MNFFVSFSNPIKIPFAFAVVDCFCRRQIFWNYSTITRRFSDSLRNLIGL